MKYLPIILLAILASFSSAQTLYVGGGALLNALTDSNAPLAHVQFGAIHEGLDFRVVYATNLVSGDYAASLIGVDILGTFPFIAASVRGYAGGGIGLASTFSRRHLALNTVLGAEYRLGSFGIFVDGGFMVVLPFPFPQARAGVNFYF